MDDSIRASLNAQRAQAADIYKQFCPAWTGDSFATWRNYPVLPEGSPQQAHNTRAVVMLLDATLSQPLLGEEFKHWNSVFGSLQQWDEKQRLIKHLTVERTKPARDAKAKLAAERRVKRQQLAVRALGRANGDTSKAAKIIGKSEKTLNRWLGDI